jgi:3-oxoacyl-[acyl-carrier-protein] synthase-3
MPRSLILGTGRAVPSRVVSNDDLSRFMDTSDEWIRARTGIQQRHWIVPGESGVALGAEASLAALAMAGVAPGDLDAIVYATSTPDHFAPGNGVFLQRALGLTDTIPAIDIRMQCAGFVYALSVADAYLRSGSFRRILVVGQEVQSTRMELSTEGRNTAVIFADGAGALVLGTTEEDGRGIAAFDLHSQGENAEKLWAEGPSAMVRLEDWPEDIAEGRCWLSMDGREVFRHAVVRMPESVRAVLDRVGARVEDITLLIPHQANLRIIEATAKHAQVPMSKVMVNVDRYGNTSAASIQLAIAQALQEGRIGPGSLLLLVTFGAGFTWGAAVVRW